MPAGVPLAGHPVVHGADSPLQLVRPEDVPALLDAWQQAFATGVGRVDVHAAGPEPRPVTVHVLDTRPQYGVLLGVFVPEDGAPLVAAAGEAARLAPRLSIVRKTRYSEILSVDDAFQQLLGFSPAEVVGRRSVEFIHPDDHDRSVANWLDLLSTAEPRRQRLRHRHAAGHWVWFEITNHNRLDDPTQACVLTEMIDITEEMTAQESLRASQQLLARLTDALPVGVVQLDRARRVVYTNARVGQILGSRDRDSLAGLFAGVLTEDLPALDEAWSGVLEQGADVDVEVGVQHPRRNRLRCRITLRPLTDDAGITGAIACIDDITEPSRLRAQLEFRATYDALTGCLNRASVLAELAQAITQDREEGAGTAVVFVDLDGFKTVNDTRGHAAGDALLQEIARQLNAGARRGDVVGRVGGDEFLLVGRGVTSAEQALAIGRRLADGLAANLDPQLGHAAVASIGVAWAAPHDGDTADQLVARADGAMYVAKRAGDGRPVLG
jgi:diguanylate cyclase (GGDEF)-like protein/PAS domain S-box-containing protein